MVELGCQDSIQDNAVIHSTRSAASHVIANGSSGSSSDLSLAQCLQLRMSHLTHLYATCFCSEIAYTGSLEVLSNVIQPT